jgi:putative PIN family toxin of toxin-antitoxin system
MIPKLAHRIVLDTNVCLDLFVFRDPRWARLHDALQSGALEAVTREDCRNEWQLVLRYAHLKLDDNAIERVAAEFDALIRCEPRLDASRMEPEQALVKLPLCKDKDDQKFLELARDAKAAVLITKDKALLKLAKKTQRDGLFAIMTPEAWLKAWPPAAT